MTVFISVVVIAHDRREFIMDALKSVFAQTLDRNRYEVIVVKNFIDETIDEYIRKMNGENIVTTEVSAGSKVLIGINASRGNVISLLSDDDLYLTQKLRRIYNIFESEVNLSYYHNAFATIDHFGHTKNFRRYKTNGIKMLISNDKVNMGDLSIMVKNLGYHNDSCISFRKEAYLDYMYALNDLKVSWDSFLFFLSFRGKNQIMIDSEILTYFRVHDSMSQTFGNYTTFINKRNILASDYIDETTLTIDLAENVAVKEYLLYIATTWKIVSAFTGSSSTKNITFTDFAIILKNIKYSIPAGRFFTIIGLMSVLLPRYFSSRLYYVYNLCR